MGWIRHHAIVVSASYGDWAGKARDKAVSLGMAVSEMVGPTINGTESFLVAPDGSKEGWSESDEGDIRRKEFKAWLRLQEYEDGSSPIRWVEVQYGDDGNVTLIVDDSDAGQRTGGSK